MQVNGKEYVFRQRVVIGQMLKVERLQKDVQNVLTSTVGANGWKARYNEWRMLHKVGNLWKEMCKVIFENADKGLDFKNLTPQEVQEIPVNFFAQLEMKPMQSKPTLDNTEEKEQTP